MEKHGKLIMRLSTIIGCILTLSFIIYGIHLKIFTSEIALDHFLKQFGIFAPIVFILFQIVQVIIPILPGGIGSLGGIMIFNPIMGFVYNYVGICLGSLGAFLLARRFGKNFVRSITNPNMYNKYLSWLDKESKFDRWFAMAIFFPIAPDDFLCYLAGLTQISSRRFLWIILLGKPLGIFVYTYGLKIVVNQMISVFC